MTTTKIRLDAINRSARDSGKSREEVFRAFAPTWDLNPGEAAALRQAMANTPEPLSPAEEQRAAEARTAATARANEMQREHDAQAIALWRQYREAKSANPFVAAQLLNHHGDEVFRGKTLDTTPDSEPPLSAA